VPGVQASAHSVEQARRLDRNSIHLTGFRPRKWNDGGTLAWIFVVGAHGE